MYIDRIFIFTFLIGSGLFVIKASENQLSPESQRIRIHRNTLSETYIASPQQLLAIAAQNGSGWDNIIIQENELKPFYLEVPNLLEKLAQKELPQRCLYTLSDIKSILNPKDTTQDELDAQDIFLQQGLIPMMIQDSNFVRFALKKNPEALYMYLRDSAYHYEDIKVKCRKTQKLCSDFQEKLKDLENCNQELLKQNQDQLIRSQQSLRESENQKEQLLKKNDEVVELLKQKLKNTEQRLQEIENQKKQYSDFKPQEEYKDLENQNKKLKNQNEELKNQNKDQLIGNQREQSSKQNLESTHQRNVVILTMLSLAIVSFGFMNRAALMNFIY